MEVNKSQKWGYRGGNIHFKKHLWKIHGIEFITVKGIKIVNVSQLQINITKWNKGIHVDIKYFKTSSTGPDYGAIYMAFLN